ncbi:ABC transporter ATP-binding protein [Aliagarivorans marinus]|uniref:ABC transporter ATP-binding protein n=1 Tax=Aliagarivorans marinus TaxID=561965 RepID=UPI0004220F13|nr:ABC transporter ATP-binding protein [Aliagarivorans marinus]
MFELDNVEVRREGRTILQVEQLAIDSSAFTVILGHNGSGKSTLVNLLTGQFAPEQGKVSLNGKPVDKIKARSLAQQVAFLPQHLPQVAGLNVSELVKLGRYPWRGSLGRWREQDQQLLEEALSQTDMGRFANELVDSLSGGERQRAFVAMLLAQQSPILVLDEPTSALDISHQYQLMSLLSELNQRSGRGVVVIIHDINLALRYASKVVALKQGKVAFAGDTAELQDEALLRELFNAEFRLLSHPELSTKVAAVC